MPTKIKRDPYGKLEGFGGQKLIHYKEAPAGFDNTLEEPSCAVDNLLPFEGFAADMELAYFRGDRRSCICLRDKFDIVVHQWPDSYEPTREEVHAEVTKHLKSIGRQVF